MTGLLDHYVQNFEDFVILGNFNEDENSPKMELFLSQKGCKNIIKSKTCFKSMFTFSGSCIDLRITSRPSLHQ